MNTLRSARLTPVFVLFLMGCASGASVRSPGFTSPNSRRVLGDELVATREPDLYGAIATCRPTFFQPRDARRQAPALYVDGIAIAEFDAIRSIPLADVVAVEFMSDPNATTRYGMDHVGGAILVWTRRGRTTG